MSLTMCIEYMNLLEFVRFKVQILHSLHRRRGPGCSKPTSYVLYARTRPFSAKSMTLEDLTNH